MYKILCQSVFPSENIFAHFTLEVGEIELQPRHQAQPNCFIRAQSTFVNSCGAFMFVILS